MDKMRSKLVKTMEKKRKTGSDESLGKVKKKKKKERELAKDSFLLFTSPCHPHDLCMTIWNVTFLNQPARGNLQSIIWTKISKNRCWNYTRLFSNPPLTLCSHTYFSFCCIKVTEKRKCACGKDEVIWFNVFDKGGCNSEWWIVRLCKSVPTVAVCIRVDTITYVWLVECLYCAKWLHNSSTRTELHS